MHKFQNHNARHRGLSILLVSAVCLLSAVGASAQRTATLPLEEWLSLKKTRDGLHQATNKTAPSIVVSEAAYAGESDGKNLLLTLRMNVLLEGPPGALASVPTLPATTVVQRARLNRGTFFEPISLENVGGTWRWTTEARGPVELEIDFVVAPTGPRGSFEYAFVGVPAVRTTFRCSFPDKKLVPRVAGATQEEVTPLGTGVQLFSVLEQAREIRISGFHDIAEDAEQDAKVYVDGQHLLSIEEDRAELFSVLRLHILYARKRRFQIKLPTGYELIRADGEGAFRSVVEERDGISMLVGETASGMKDRYEISLRLRRTLPTDSAATVLTAIEVPIPRLVSAERDTGAVAVELPGRLTYEGHTGETLRAVDPRELPESLVESSVSPIIAAFRYTEDKGPTSLKLTRVPAHPVAAGGVDRVDATTVVTDDGRRMTDVRFSLRNLLRRHLAVELPPGAKVESAYLDGAPVKPSTDAEGRVLLPLVRSPRDGNRLRPLSVQLVYVEDHGALGWAGIADLVLPKLEVPISSVKWTTYVPRRYRTAGTFDERSVYVRSARFERPRRSSGVGGQSYSRMQIDNGALNVDLAMGANGFGRGGGGLNNVMGGVQGEAMGHTHRGAGHGAMPVRIKIPTEGRPHNVRRDWVREGETVQATVYLARVPVVIAAQLLSGLLLALLFFGAARSRRRRLALVVLAVGTAAAFAVTFSVGMAVFAAVVGLGVAALSSAIGRNAVAAVRSFFEFQSQGLRERAMKMWAKERGVFVERRSRHLLLALGAVALRLAWISFAGFSLLWLTIAAGGLGISLLRLLSNPL